MLVALRWQHLLELADLLGLDSQRAALEPHVQLGQAAQSPFSLDRPQLLRELPDAEEMQASKAMQAGPAI